MRYRMPGVILAVIITQVSSTRSLFTGWWKTVLLTAFLNQSDIEYSYISLPFNQCRVINLAMMTLSQSETHKRYGNPE